jgi:hypothetical protein
MYRYEKMKPQVFLEENQQTFLSIRDNVQRLLCKESKVRLNAILQGVFGDTWLMMACVDRLVELGEIREAPTNGPAQHRVFVLS